MPKNKLQSREYAHGQWAEEFEFNPRGILLACPSCGLRGYMAYQSEAVPEYCMCKLCGFWQAVGGEVKRCAIFYHDCKGDKLPLPPTGHPRRGFCYVDNEDAEEVSCEYCTEIITERAKWPAELDNPADHPFLKH